MKHLMKTAICIVIVGLLVLGVFTVRYAYVPGDFQEFICRSERNQRLEPVGKAATYMFWRGVGP